MFAPGAALNGFLKDAGQPEASASLSEEELLRRPEITLSMLTSLDPGLANIPADAAEQAEISIKYAGYLEKQEQMIRKAMEMEKVRLPENLPYLEMEHLRLEARQKLARQKPVSLGAAGRIPGVNPADVAVLAVWMEKKKREAAEGAASAEKTKGNPE